VRPSINRKNSNIFFAKFRNLKKVLKQEKIPIDLIVGTSIGALVGAAYALNPDAEALERRLSEVLDPKENGKAGLKLLGKVQWDNSVKSDFLRRIVRIAQKEMFLKNLSG
jgi:NTE family protein